MSKFKKVLEICAVEIMIGGGFFITGILCLSTAEYVGTLVCAGVAVVAGAFARVRWNAEGDEKPEEVFIAATVSTKKPQPSKPRRKPVKAKKPAKRK